LSGVRPSFLLCRNFLFVCNVIVLKIKCEMVLMMNFKVIGKVLRYGDISPLCRK